MPKGKTLRIIALTAHALSGERERCLARGMTDYLAKPFRGHELFALVEHGAAAAPAGVPVASAALIPPVDVDGFRTMMREVGAGEAVDSILDMFVRSAPERLAALARAAANGVGPDIAKAAHVLRGAAATIGARDLAGMLERVETAAGAGRIAEAQEGFEDLSPAAREVVEYLRSQLAGAAETPSGG